MVFAAGLNLRKVGTARIQEWLPRFLFSNYIK